MRALALDLGDTWTGTALSDPLGLLARPYETILTKDLDQFLRTLFRAESIDIVVIGNPRTLRGTTGTQALKVHACKESLEQTFPEKTWVLWDERFSSREADLMSRPRSAHERRRSHSIAAALILESYLEYVAHSKMANST